MGNLVLTDNKKLDPRRCFWGDGCDVCSLIVKRTSGVISDCSYNHGQQHKMLEWHGVFLSNDLQKISITFIKQI